jgi:hypothetical protein
VSSAGHFDERCGHCAPICWEHQADIFQSFELLSAFGFEFSEYGTEDAVKAHDKQYLWS